MEEQAELKHYDPQHAVPKESVHRKAHNKVDWSEIDKTHERSRSAGLAMAKHGITSMRWMDKQRELWALSIDLLRLAMEGMTPNSANFQRAGKTRTHFKQRIEEVSGL